MNHLKSTISSIKVAMETLICLRDCEKYAVPYRCQSMDDFLKDKPHIKKQYDQFFKDLLGARDITEAILLGKKKKEDVKKAWPLFCSANIQDTKECNPYLKHILEASLISLITQLQMIQYPSVIWRLATKDRNL